MEGAPKKSNVDEGGVLKNSTHEGMSTKDKEGTKKEAKKNALPRWRRIFGVPITEKIFFVQHLSVMLRAGISLGEALTTLSKQTKNKIMGVVLKDIAVRTNEGKSLAESLRLYPNVFEELFVNMIAAGEVSGKYEEALQEIHSYMKKSHEIRGKIKGAMIYPVVILIAMLIIGIIMMTFVVPKLISIFDEAGADLPLPTRILIVISDSFLNYGLFIGIGIIILGALSIYTFKKETPKRFLHTIILKLPIFGPIIQKVNIARFSRTLGALLKTDIPIIESLRITSKVLDNRLYRNILEASAEHVKKGKTISSLLSQNEKLFFPVVTQMVHVGEKTGSLDSVLKELAEFYEEEVSQTMDNLPSVIEPILIIVLGVAVGGMAVALIMPLYSITEAI